MADKEILEEVVQEGTCSVEGVSISNEETLALFNKVKSGDMNAKAELVEAFKQFITDFANKHSEHYSPEYPEVTFDFCFEAGVKGIDTAIDTYKEERGFGATIYTVWRIRQAIARAAFEVKKAVHKTTEQLDWNEEQDRMLTEMILAAFPDKRFYKRPKATLIKMYGLDGGKQYTLAEMARVFKISKDNTGHIYAKALRLMRHPIRSKPLREYVDWAIENPTFPCAQLISDIFGLGPRHGCCTPLRTIIMEKEKEENQ